MGDHGLLCPIQLQRLFGTCAFAVQVDESHAEPMENILCVGCPAAPGSQTALLAIGKHVFLEKASIS